MTVNQIAKAIEYNPAGTAKALERMEAAGQVLRDQDGRWAVALEGDAKVDEYAYAAE